MDLTDAPRRPALIEQLEQEMASDAPRCGAKCACHGDILCLRAEHPHDHDADMGPGQPRGNVSPHLGRDADGQLVQWLHTDQHGPMLSAGEVAEQAAAARREHTLAVLGTLDLDVLREALMAGGPERYWPEGRR